jgi:hypothetical protein
MEAVEGNRVLEHILMRNKVLDGDNYILHVQVTRWMMSGQQPGWQQHTLQSPPPSLCPRATPPCHLPLMGWF